MSKTKTLTVAQITAEIADLLTGAARHTLTLEQVANRLAHLNLKIRNADRTGRLLTTHEATARLPDVERA